MDKESLLSKFKESGIQSDEKIFVAPFIPEKKVINAIQSHGLQRKCKPRDILVLIDDTVFGSAKDGLVITSDFISFKGIFEDPIAFDFEDIYEVENDGPALIINGQKFKFVQPDKTNIYKLYLVLDEILGDTEEDDDEYDEDADENSEVDDSDDESIDLLAIQFALIDTIEECKKEYSKIMENVKRIYLGIDGLSKSAITMKADNCGKEVGYSLVKLAMLVQLRDLVEEYNAEIDDLKKAGLVGYLNSLIYLTDSFEENANNIQREIGNYFSDATIKRLEKDINSSSDEDETKFLEKFKGFLECTGGLLELTKAALDDRQFFQASFNGTANLVAMGGIYYILQLSKKAKIEAEKVGLWVAATFGAKFIDNNWPGIKDEFAKKVFR